MFTVRRLGVSDRLARSLSTTNAAESMISVARDTTRRVKRWRDGTMVKRWVAARAAQRRTQLPAHQGLHRHADPRRRPPPPRPRRCHTRLRR